MLQDYYAILEVKPDATLKEIKLAYRKKIKIYHPDLHKGKEAEKNAKLINEAYNILSDSIKRQNYDIQHSIFNNTNYNGSQPFTSQVYTNRTNTVNININQSSGNFRVENPDGTFYNVEWHQNG